MSNHLPIIPTAEVLARLKDQVKMYTEIIGEDHELKAAFGGRLQELVSTQFKIEVVIFLNHLRETSKDERIIAEVARLLNLVKVE